MKTSSYLLAAPEVQGKIFSPDRHKGKCCFSDDGLDTLRPIDGMNIPCYSYPHTTELVSEQLLGRLWRGEGTQCSIDTPGYSNHRR